MQKVQSGQYPSNGFYLQSIFFEQGDLNNFGFYNKVIEVADSVNAIVTTGTAQWKTLKQAYTQWETVYNAQMFQWECGQIVSGIENNYKNSFNIYPNPASEKIIIEMSNKNAANAELKIYNVFGNLVYQSIINNSVLEINIKQWTKGMYFYQLKNNNTILSASKIVIE